MPLEGFPDIPPAPSPMDWSTQTPGLLDVHSSSRSCSGPRIGRRASGRELRHRNEGLENDWQAIELPGAELKEKPLNQAPSWQLAVPTPRRFLGFAPRFKRHARTAACRSHVLLLVALLSLVLWSVRPLDLLGGYSVKMHDLRALLRHAQDGPSESAALPFHLYHDASETSQALRFRSLSDEQRRARVRPLKMHEPLLQGDCLDLWVAHGEVCASARWDDRGGVDSPAMAAARRAGRGADLVVTWVNGTDARHQAARKLYAQRPGGWWEEHWREPWKWAVRIARIKQRLLRLSRGGQDEEEEDDENLANDTANRYRDNGELKYALRSAYEHLLPLDTIHLVSPDFATPAPTSVETLLRLGDEDAARLPSEVGQEESSDLFVLDDGSRRQGQLPSWLNLTNAKVLKADCMRSCHSPSETTAPHLRLHHDSQLFSPLDSRFNFSSPSTTAAYRRSTAPTFNSQSIESTFSSSTLRGLGEQWLMSSDDFFLLSNLGLADVGTPLFGPVLRLSEGLDVRGTRRERLNDFRRDHAVSRGEWPGLEATATLLDERFGKRPRPYVAHAHRSMVTPLLDEFRAIWAEEVQTVASRRFRGMSGGGLAIHHLFSHAVIERHREALLWTYLVLRSDRDGDGLLSVLELEMLLREIGVGMKRGEDGALNLLDVPNGGLPVPWPIRDTLREDILHFALAVPGLGGSPMATRYRWASQDGYALLLSSPKPQPHRTPGPGFRSKPPTQTTLLWPSLTSNSTRDPLRPSHACRLNLQPCLLPFLSLQRQGKPTTPQALFACLAFEDKRAGDCLISRLVLRSGQRGMSAFLPPPGAKFAPSSSSSTVKDEAKRGLPFLPLSNHHPTSSLHPSSSHRSDAKLLKAFSAHSVALQTNWQGSDKRRFAVRLIHRYAHVVGTSEVKFQTLTGAFQTRQALSTIKSSRAKWALLCLNDDFENPDISLWEDMRDFGEEMWPVAAPWESSS